MTTNPYPLGQCTWYVQSRYPDIPWDMGDGGDWFDIGGTNSQGFRSGGAVGHGWATSKYPRPGWVVVYRRGSGVSRFGHVGVVETVAPDSLSFVLSEMNWRAWNVVDYRTDKTDNPSIAGFFQPPGAPAGEAMPAGLAVVSAGSASPATGALVAPSAWWDGLLSVLKNSALVIGGALVAGVGLLMLGSRHKGVMTAAQAVGARWERRARTAVTTPPQAPTLRVVGSDVSVDRASERAQRRAEEPPPLVPSREGPRTAAMERAAWRPRVVTSTKPARLTPEERANAKRTDALMRQRAARAAT